MAGAGQGRAGRSGLSEEVMFELRLGDESTPGVRSSGEAPAQEDRQVWRPWGARGPWAGAVRLGARTAAGGPLQGEVGWGQVTSGLVRNLAVVLSVRKSPWRTLTGEWQDLPLNRLFWLLRGKWTQGELGAGMEAEGPFRRWLQGYSQRAPAAWIQVVDVGSGPSSCFGASQSTPPEG